MVEISSSSNFIITSTPRLVKRELTNTTQRVGMIRSVPSSGDLGRGLSDRIFLIGHADGLQLNDPYQVVNIQDTINMLGADTNSPLLRGLFDAYNEGARDIWLVAAAPMNEYVPDLSERNTSTVIFSNQTFYELYKSRLDTTYSILRDFEIAELVVPLEAPFYGSEDVDFMSQLADHCADAFDNTGRIRIGFLGTRISAYDGQEIYNITQDSRLSTVSASDGGKFTILIGGEVSVNHPQIEIGYSISASTLAAAKLSTARMERGLTHRKFNAAINPSQSNYTDEELSTLALAKVNWIGRSQLGKRGIPYQVYPKSDNTLAADNSTLWAIAQMRIMSKVVNTLKAMGTQFIGSIEYPAFKQEVRDYLNFLVIDESIREYRLNISRSEDNPETAIVDVTLMPYGTLREVFLSVNVGNRSAIS
jgi:hypothetical protein